MRSCFFTAHNLQDTDRLGSVLAELLPEGTAVALCGTLGAGKTRLVQAVAAACGVPRSTVVSPTFVLCQEYHGQRTLYHLDAYRLKDSHEFLQLGPEEYLDSPALTLIEWGDRISDCLPDERVEIHIEIIGETSHKFRIVAIGSRFESLLPDLQSRLQVRG